MPASLPPDYFQAEKRFCAARTQAEKIACLEEMMSTVPRPLLPVSAASGRNFEQLKRQVLDRLDIMGVYAKPPGKPADTVLTAVPFVLKKGSKVTDLARKIHRDFYEQLKSARVWGSSEFAGQKVQRDYVLQEGDVVELRV